MRTGEPGFWWRAFEGAGAGPPTRAPLTGPAEADVAIVGAGLTGLWTAYYLALARPSLQIVVLERETVGFGASGRNGGWVSGFFSGPSRANRRSGGRDALIALQREMLGTVDEIGRVLLEEGIDADFLKSGQVRVALNAPQELRLRERVRQGRERGLGEQDLHALGGAQLRERLTVAGARAGLFSPHVARVQPAKLVDGLARAVEGLGVAIHERTPVSEIGPRLARTPAGGVRARWVVRATEGYTPQLPGLGRVLVPINSSMIVTEPLSAGVWDQIGWRGGELLSDEAHVYVYLQRTADGRIAIGGRGVPYRFGSRTDRRGETAAATVAALRERLRAMFPATAGARVEHAWSGVLGVARDWCVSIDADPRSGLAWGGGYVGEGVAASNLVGRTLRDLILGDRSELTALPWVGHSPRRWELEPLRWAGIRGVYALYRRGDRVEQRGQRPSRLASIADTVSRRT